MEVIKDKGNAAFKDGKYKEAINYYTEAIHIAIGSDKLVDEFDAIENTESLLRQKQLIKSNDCLHKCLNNRSQCYLKLGKFKKAIEDSSRILIAVPDDAKALFRRSHANKELEKLDEAMKDAKRLITIDSKNKESIDLMQALNKLIIQKTNEQRSTKSQAKTMLDLAKSEQGEKKITALNNLIVLGKEDAGANEILALDGMNVLKNILKESVSNDEAVLAIARIFSSVCKNSFRRVNIIFKIKKKSKEKKT